MSKIDHDLTQIRGIAFDIDGVLSPATIPLGSDGVPCRMVNIKDGYAMQLAVKHGYKIALITGANSLAVDIRYRSLGIESIYMKAGKKIDVFRDWMKEQGLTPQQTAYVGDDIPDYECMQEAGLPVCPADAAEEIKSVSTYISPVKGGYGVARDLLEEIMKAQNNWVLNEKAFGW